MVKGVFVSAKAYIAIISFLAIALFVMGVLTVKQKYGRAEFEAKAIPEVYDELVFIAGQLEKKYDHIRKADSALSKHIRSMPTDMRTLALKALEHEVNDYFLLATKYNEIMVSWEYRFTNQDLLPEGASHGALPRSFDPIVFIQSGEEV